MPRVDETIVARAGGVAIAIPRDYVSLTGRGRQIEHPLDKSSLALFVVKNSRNHRPKRNTVRKLKVGLSAGDAFVIGYYVSWIGSANRSQLCLALFA